MSTRAKHELDHEDLQILEECLSCARSIMKAHTREEKSRKRMQENFEELPKRWQVSPAVAKALVNTVPRLLDMSRTLLNMPALVRKIVKKGLDNAVKLTSISDMPSQPMLPYR
ncbi:MAG: hypothetical protein V3V10_01300 [Planctomycetota bacterium]